MKIFIKTLLTVATLSTLLVGCTSGTTQPETISSGIFTSQLTFDGSSTLAPVVSKIGQEFQDQYQTWNQVDASFPSEKIDINVISGGSGQGIKSIIEKTSDVGMVARSVKAEEKEQIPDLQEIQIGIDALTISVSPNNPVLSIKDNLTKDEIVSLFSGEYKYWSDLDASLPQEEVIVVTRDIGGGAHEVFQSKIMGDTEVKADAIQAPSMGALVQKVMENDYTIGYASFGVVNQNAGKVLPLKVEGTPPTEDNIKSGEYIIQRPLIFVVNGELSPSAQAFMDYITSDKGLSIVSELGFIPTK
ncbi:MAG: phosphate ABC transporter substrate-binding protein [Cellulosilyticaceae bacterium]